MLGDMNDRLPPADWYPDPAGTADQRFWDGSNWSQSTRRTPAAQPAPEAAQPSAPQWQPGPQSYAAQQPHAQQPYAQHQYAQHQYAPQPAMRIAGWWWRVLAYIIDGAILYLPVTMIQTWILGDRMDMYISWVNRVVMGYDDPFPAEVMQAFLISAVVVLLLWIVYRGLLVGWKGGTLGHLVCGMRVIEDGDQSLAVPSMGKAFGRAAGFMIMGYVPILGLVNVLWPLGNPQRQALHDRIAKTLVLKKN